MAITDIVRYAGNFQVWSYTSSHDCLLLRRNRDINSGLIRAEILFKDVSWIMLSTGLIDNVFIQAVSADEFYSAHKCAKILPDSAGRYIFLVNSGEHQGIVVASLVGWHEADLDYSQPSVLLEPNDRNRTEREWWPTEVGKSR